MIQKTFNFNFYSFFIAFFMGLLYIYIESPKPRLIIKYPTPYNVGKIIYKNSSGNCYKFKADIVSCPINTIEQPIS